MKAKNVTITLENLSDIETVIPACDMKVSIMNRDVWRNVTFRETTIPK